MTWRLALSLAKLRAQVNVAFPLRDKASDGTIGDAAHASRDSDHNPWVPPPDGGVVTAMDLTHDPVRCDAGRLTEVLVASRDPRIKYVIYNRRIWRAYAKPGIPAWTPAPYTGVNAHMKHVHVSVQAAPALYDDAADWNLPREVVPA